MSRYILVTDQVEAGQVAPKYVSDADPLPVAVVSGGDATAANQVIGNNSLANIDSDLGAPADAAATTDTGTFSILAFIKRFAQNWTALLSRIPALISGRIPVDGSGVTQPVSAATLPLPTGAATETTLAAASAKLPATLGQKTSANSLAVVLPSDQTVATSSKISVATDGSVPTPTPGGAAYQQLGPAAASIVLISNDTGFQIDVSRTNGGAGVPLASQQAIFFPVVANSTELFVRRNDLTAVALTVKYTAIL